tara:strand:- start:2278 stop:2394 length:117 start_codon:yes stop_codon:yes gene_type:complete
MNDDTGMIQTFYDTDMKLLKKYTWTVKVNIEKRIIKDT